MATNIGVNPPDFSTVIGQVRALLGDTDAIDLVPPVAGQGSYMWFRDDEISAIAALYSDNPKRTAARLLLTIAGSQALLIKKWSSDDLSVDGAAIAEALRKQAKDLQDEADNEAANIDIFEISYPGSDYSIRNELAEGPWPFPPFGPSDGGSWTVDDDGYIVNG